MTDIHCTQQDWSDSVSVRVVAQYASKPEQLAHLASHQGNATNTTTSTVTAQPTDMTNNCSFTRAKPESLGALATLPDNATLLVLTPVLAPAGTAPPSIAQEGTVDPFEPFGLALCDRHPNVRHVPYVPAVGFTDTHAYFINKADVVVVMVCEPDRRREDSLSDQMDFAEEVLDEINDPDIPGAADMLVLVQCRHERFGIVVDEGFENVVEASTYNVEVAKAIADAIFRFKE